MSWYAIDRVEDAIDLTRDRLWPVEPRVWLRFALLMFFVGGGGGLSIPPVGQSFSGGDAGGSGEWLAGIESIPGWVVLAVIGLVIVGIALAIAFAVIGALMEFVFVDSLRSETIEIRDSARRFVREGLHLFGFRLGLGLIVVAIVALPIVLIGALIYLGVPGMAVLLLLIFGLLTPIAIGLFAVLGAIGGITTHFVVPIMMLDDCGVIAAWKRLWGPLKAEWKQLAVFLLVMVVLNTAVSLVGGMAGLLAGFVLAIPFVTVGVPVAAIVVAVDGGPIAIAGIALLGALVVVYSVLMIVTSLLINVPLETYRRYFVLLVLGDFSDEFDIIPDRRPAIEE